MSNFAALKTERKPAKQVIAADTQQVCIDLPGEEVRCYVYKPKLEIMLRKHRDVVLDIQLFKGMQYTVEADTSDFYNVRDKKIVLRARKQKVKLDDGERLHLWVGRAFKGDLILKANGKLLGRYSPNQLDCNRYDDEPTTKPAPLIVVMHNEPGSAAQAHKPATLALTAKKPFEMPAETAWTPPYAAPTVSARHDQVPTETMHILEVKDGVGVMPQDLAAFFKNGGEDTAIDTNKIVTRNWLWAQIVGATAYLGDNQPWIKELWNQKFYLQKVKGKTYVIFKGSPRLRSFLTGTRYLTDTPKVIAISAGVGTLRGVHKASWEAAKGSFKGAAKLALVFTITLDVAEWIVDYEERDPITGKPKRDVYDLGAKVLTDAIWAAAGAGVATLLMAGVVATGAVGVGAIVVIGSIGFAMLAGFGFAWIDSQTGITPTIAKAASDAAAYLHNKLPRDYVDYESAVRSMMFGGAP